MNAAVENVLLILFGWALGLLSPIIADAAARHRKKREVRAALQIELGELRYRLASSAHQILLEMGEVTREGLQWFRSIVADYHGPQRSEHILSSIDALLKLSDSELQQLAAAQRESFGSGLSLKRFDAPVLVSIPNLTMAFSDQFQKQLVQIQTGLGFLNEDIENSRFYFRLTFNGGLPGQNHKIVVDNMKKSYLITADHMKSIANQIGGLDW